MIEQVRKALALDGDIQFAQVYEVGRTQAPGMVLLREKHLLGWPFRRAPHLEPALQSTQLPVREASRIAPL